VYAGLAGKKGKCKNCTWGYLIRSKLIELNTQGIVSTQKLCWESSSKIHVNHASYFDSGAYHWESWGGDTDDPDISVVSSVPPRTYHDSTLKESLTASFHEVSKSLFPIALAVGLGSRNFPVQIRRGKRKTNIDFRVTWRYFILMPAPALPTPVPLLSLSLSYDIGSLDNTTALNVLARGLGRLF
jgi:hypothetical protein